MEKEPKAVPQKQQHCPFQDHQTFPKENIIEKLKSLGVGKGRVSQINAGKTWNDHTIKICKLVKTELPQNTMGWSE